MARKIIVAAPVSDSLKKRIVETARGFEVEFLPEGAPAYGPVADQNLMDRLNSDPGVEVVYSTVVPSGEFTAPALRWVQSTNAGMEAHVNKPVWKNQDVIITNSSGGYGAAIGQWAAAVILWYFQQLGPMQEYKRSRTWPADKRIYDGTLLAGKSLGIVGYGDVGRECARIAAALGLRLRATKRNPGVPITEGRYVPPFNRYKPAFDDSMVEILPSTSLHDMLAQSDIVIIAAPATPETHKLIGGAEISAMPHGSFLVNLARGSLLDTDAFIDGVRRGHLAGGVLDVYDPEPTSPGDAVFDLPDSVYLTPHIAGSYKDNLEDLGALFADNLERYVKGETLYNIVDRTHGY